MKIIPRITSRNHERVTLVLLTCFLNLSMPGTSVAQMISVSREENVKIALKGNYRLALRFNEYPRNIFNLWLPELAIFDADMDRSRAAEPIDGVWLAKREGNLQVKGRLDAGEKGMVFTCMLKPLTSSALMLELEVANSGKTDWNDYTQLAVCLAPAEGNKAFSDTSGDRTYINSQAAGIQSINGAGEVGEYNHYVVGNLNDPDDPAQRVRVRDGFVARQISEGQLAISFMWDDAARVDVNPGGLDCMHSHPAAGPLKAGESKTLHGFIMIREGTAEDHYASMKSLIDQHRTE